MYIPLRRQNDRTSNNIKHINSMKALELKDLKAGNIYKRTDKNYYTECSAYVEVISEGVCNYIFIMYNEQGEVAYFYVNKNCPLKEIQTLYARYELSTKKKFKAAIKMIKDSLTF